MTLCPTSIVFALLAGLWLLPTANAEDVKGPVHIQGSGGRHSGEDGRAGIAEAREGIAEVEKGLADAARDLAAAEAGDFSGVLTIEDDEVIKCGDPARYPGCVLYTAAEKAGMVEEMRGDLAEARADLDGARRDLAQSEGELAEEGKN